MVLKSTLLFSFKSLFASKGGFIITVSGVSLAILLILTLRGIEQGALRQATIYVDQSGADIFVMQKGSRETFRGRSILPRGMSAVIKTVPGVSTVSAIVQGAADFNINGKRAYIIYFGFDPITGVGGPWSVVEGEAEPKAGQLILDQVLASKLGISLGDTVFVRDLPFEVSGLSNKSVTAIGSYAFFTKEDALEIMRLQRVVNHFQVRLKNKQETAQVLAAIERSVPDVSAFSKSQFRQNHLDVVREIIIPPMEVMVFISLLIGTVIISLTIYTMTEARKKEYGILKAVGVKNSRLYLIILSQAVICALFGFFLALILTFVTIRLISLLVPEVEVVVDFLLLLKIFVLAFFMSGLAAYVPARLTAKVDPVVAFRE